MNTSTTKKSNKSNGNANPNYQSLGFFVESGFVENMSRYYKK